MNPLIKDFFDENTNTFSYVVSDPMTHFCAIIDSVLDYDAPSATTHTRHADQIIAYIKEYQLKVQWILETHVHADHLTASQYLKEQLGGQIAMSEKITAVQEIFSKIYNIDIKTLNSHQSFDYLFKDHEQFKIGEIEAYNIPTPGHTPACLSYVIGNAVFVGDTLFMPDYGTARCDFPKGSASQLFDSVNEIYKLPDHMQMYLCHDYLPVSRQNYICQTDIKTQRNENIHIHMGVSKPTFVQMREQRDATLTMPKLILPAIQVNMDGGKFPEPDTNGLCYLKLPFNYFK